MSFRASVSVAFAMSASIFDEREQDAKPKRGGFLPDERSGEIPSGRVCHFERSREISPVEHVISTVASETSGTEKSPRRCFRYTYSALCLSFVWRGVRAVNARTERSKKRKNDPSIGNKLPPAPHSDGEPWRGMAPPSLGRACHFERSREISPGRVCHFDCSECNERNGEISRATLQIHFSP